MRKYVLRLIDYTPDAIDIGIGKLHITAVPTTDEYGGDEVHYEVIFVDGPLLRDAILFAADLMKTQEELTQEGLSDLHRLLKGRGTLDTEEDDEDE